MTRLDSTRKMNEIFFTIEATTWKLINKMYFIFIHLSTLYHEETERENKIYQT